MTPLEIILAVFFVCLVGFLTGIFYFIFKGLLIIGKILLLAVAAIIWIILLPLRRGE